LSSGRDTFSLFREKRAIFRHISYEIHNNKNVFYKKRRVQNGFSLPFRPMPFLWPFLSLVFAGAFRSVVVDYQRAAGVICEGAVLVAPDEVFEQ
jgi:hypothetical protein